MRFRRSHTPAQAPSSESVPVPVNLAEVPFDGLWHELRRREWVVIPDGLWEATIGDLQRQVAEAESRAEEAEAKKLEALELMGKVLAESRDVRVRAEDAESEIQRFAAAFVATEFPDMTTNPDDEDPDD